MKKLMYTLGLMIFSCLIYGQTVLQGTVTDSETGEPILYGNVAVYKDGLLITGCETDLDGKYVINSLDPGTYDVEATYLGYNHSHITSVVVEANRINNVDIQMTSAGIVLEECVVIQYKAPLIRACETTSGAIVTGERIRSTPTKDINKIVGVTAGASTIDGRSVSIRGSRTHATESIIDGTRVFERKTNPSMPSSPVAEEINRAYQLTAGEVNDFLKWDLWEDINEAVLASHQKEWGIHAKNRYSVQLSNMGGFPLSDAEVKLKDKAGEVIWQSRTDNFGRAELWVNVFEEDVMEGHEIEVNYNGDIQLLSKINSFDLGINSITMEANCNDEQSVDISFIVDATGSMGDELEYLKNELEELIHRVEIQNVNNNIKTSAVFYRDKGDLYLTKSIDFSKDITKTIDFISRQSAGGGGDHPEAVHSALDIAINTLQWSENAKARLAFLILDAPPHNDDNVKESLKVSILEAAKKGISIIPLVCSGNRKSAEYLMRNIALLTNGTYLFLTDDSGIGGSHSKPTTDNFDVELLNDLLLNTINNYIYTPDCDFDKNEMSNLAEYVKEPTDELNRINGNIKADKNSIKVYPNPTAGRLNITSKQKIESMYTTDMRGKIIEQFSSLDKKDKIDISEYASGLYFIVWKDSKGLWHSEKVIKTKGVNGISFR